MRNPKWHRDEIILALDLYFSKDRGSIDSRNPKVIELSILLNKLPIFAVKPDKEKFRNPNGVSLKLANFLAIEHRGKGMKAGSKLDKLIFKEYQYRITQLKNRANEIKKIGNNDDLCDKLFAVEEDDLNENYIATEARLKYKLHRVRERDPRIVKLKKKQVLRNTGKLCCEACEFDFFRVYGEHGKGFIECHHRTSLASFTTATKTTLGDLALVCSNCHRMLHRNINTMDIRILKGMIKK